MKLSELSPAQRRKLASQAGTSDDTLRHIISGRRSMSSEAAIRLERAAKRLKLDIRREDLNSGCATCEFARKCRKP